MNLSPRVFPARLVLPVLGVAAVLALGACSGEPDQPATVTRTVTADSPEDPPTTTHGSVDGDDDPSDAADRLVFAEHGARDARLDCAGGEVEITANDAEVDLTGECTRVLVTGHGNEVDVESSDLDSLEISGNDELVDVDGHVAALMVSGHGGTIEVGSVDTVQVSGNGVRIEYERGPAPDVDDAGHGTEVVQD